MGTRECDCCVNKAVQFCLQHEMHACVACWAKHQAAEHTAPPAADADLLSDVVLACQEAEGDFTAWEQEFLRSVAARAAAGASLSSNQRDVLRKLWDTHCSQ